jgi:hypothetical protein
MADNVTSQTTIPHDPGTATGRQNEHRGGRNRNRNSHGSNNRPFQGKISDLEGHVYDVKTNDPTKTFQKTTEEIAEYVARTLPDAGEYRLGLIELSLPDISPPADPDESGLQNVIVMEKWKAAYKLSQDLQKVRKTNQGKVFAIVLGQCTTAMRDELLSDDAWGRINSSTDVIGLLKLIQRHSNVKISKGEFSHQAIEAEHEFSQFKQGPTLTLQEYYQAFKD